jgi:hypothetical protein
MILRHARDRRIDSPPDGHQHARVANCAEPGYLIEVDAIAVID